MTTYITKNSEYPVEKIGEFDVIRCLKGPTKGKPYAILGSIDSDKYKVHWIFDSLFVNSTPFSEETFKEFTEEDVREESRIVSILIDESNEKLAWGQEGDLMLTSKVQEIRE